MFSHVDHKNEPESIRFDRLRIPIHFGTSAEAKLNLVTIQLHRGFNHPVSTLVTHWSSNDHIRLML
jgi:hypothetical protein